MRRCRARYLVTFLALTSLSLVTHHVRGEVPEAGAGMLGIDVRAELAEAQAQFDRAQQLQQTNPDQARQLFRAAAQRFELIAESGVRNARLEFNIGNSHLQAGDVGRAILHYLRARRLQPGDEALHANLAEAESRRIATIRPTRGDALLRNVFFWHYDTAPAVRWRVAVAAWLLLWILLTIRIRWPRRQMGIAALVCLVVAVACGASVAVQRWTEERHPPGVITAMDVPVFKGPGASYQRQFEQPLQPGVTFALEERRGTWWEIRLPDGKSGWVESDQAELVVPS